VRRNRLIGAFAAEAKVELLAKDGFAWPRKNIVERGQVHVRTANNRDKRLFDHRLISADLKKID
jgi:hypothetical protein